VASGAIRHDAPPHRPQQRTHRRGRSLAGYQLGRLGRNRTFTWP
jgi:hypothetical protein